MGRPEILSVKLEPPHFGVSHAGYFADGSGSDHCLYAAVKESVPNGYDCLTGKALQYIYKEAPCPPEHLLHAFGIRRHGVGLRIGDLHPGKASEVSFTQQRTQGEGQMQPVIEDMRRIDGTGQVACNEGIEMCAAACQFIGERRGLCASVFSEAARCLAL